jgi:RNA polymerase sigma factor for flagellar operon FliA
LKTQELVKSFLPRIKYIVRSIKYDELPPVIDEEDLYQMAVIGLYDAAQKYDEKKGSFSTYANIRVKGYILDELRKLDYVPRHRREQAKALKEFVENLEIELSRQSSSKDVVMYMGIDVDRYNEIVDSANYNRLVSLDQKIDEDEGLNIRLSDLIQDNRTPEEYVEKEQIEEILRNAINRLSKKEKLVIYLYYYEELRMKEIGEIIGCSEPRVSQIHKIALEKLKKYVEKYIKVE